MVPRARGIDFLQAGAEFGKKLVSLLWMNLGQVVFFAEVFA
jgi:hypothetical protein